MFKTELHAHTAEVSPCAKMKARDVVDAYIEAGYSTLVITDHFCDYVINNAGATWTQKIDHYLAGYRRAKEYAGDRLNVLLGLELRFEGSSNDYLMFGVTEEFLYSHPELHKMKLNRFRPFAIQNDIFINQAHPFRNSLDIVKPNLLDGMEVFNATPTSSHDSRNDIANLWAQRFGLIRTSGSDFHGTDHRTLSGIMTDERITSSEQLVAILRSETHTLICEGEVAKEEGLSTMPAAYERKK
ncbi:MAG: PHP domain-containing protein [Clostridia bacterium]|nr:PHP domain-containing protein [Clostridia bacterium]